MFMIIMSNNERLSHRKNEVKKERKDDGFLCAQFCKFLLSLFIICNFFP